MAAIFSNIAPNCKARVTVGGSEREIFLRQKKMALTLSDWQRGSETVGGVMNDLTEKIAANLKSKAGVTHGGGVFSCTQRKCRTMHPNTLME